ncbi:uncharacterized protein LOC113295947 [Papaver somniferum]|uniref:uncharacterized protein LOC113295947 n=1 Tax=Papaver somniferum TaxID=3469 RepID=UPI000E6F7C6C|nr:uncharacterized protein LOC113295947 [Papaver somniferum]
MKESVQPHVPQFSGKNYDRWSIQMKVLFGFQELTEVVEAGFFDVNDPVVGAALPQAQRDELRENRRKDKKALYFIHQALDDALRDNGEVLADSRVVEKIMRSLTEPFDYVVAAIEEGKDMSSITIDGLEGSLCAYEFRMKQRRPSSLEHALQSKVVITEKGSSSNANSSSPGKGTSPRKKDKSTVQCYRCKLNGHYRSECRMKLPKKNAEHANYVELEEEERLFFTCSGDDDEEHRNNWYLTQVAQTICVVTRSYF